jgi:hypothetical protein
LHNERNGRSVTPAMGATIRLFFSWMGPIFNFDGSSRGFPAERAEKLPILYATQIAEKLNFAHAI